MYLKDLPPDLVKKWQEFKNKADYRNGANINLGKCDVSFGNVKGELFLEISPILPLQPNAEEAEGIIIPINENDIHITSLVNMSEYACGETNKKLAKELEEFIMEHKKKIQNVTDEIDVD